MSDNSKSPYWHGMKPFIEFPRVELPWRQRPEPDYAATILHLAAMSIFMRPDPRSLIYTDPKAKYAWWDGSCLCTDLMIEGPKSIVKWEPR